MRNRHANSAEPARLDGVTLLELMLLVAIVVGLFHSELVQWLGID